MSPNRDETVVCRVENYSNLMLFTSESLRYMRLLGHLLEFGASINAVNNRQRTALHLAVNANHAEVETVDLTKIPHQAGS